MKKIESGAVSDQVGGTATKVDIAKAATGDTNGAISDFTKSIEIDTKYLEPLLNRSFVLEMQGKLKKACNDWEKASVLGSKDAKTWHIAQCK